ncbi:CAP domain-containing protein [Thermaerobacillus caldiproteolyticus]|uniref:Putative YkwD family protein n=1 Tax=Thermaerobacillus caldiproteolyticus TaxID=247480 RepID=A0A7W0BZH8_9BACL|nr:CAP domain-containing protein [Anoxybacillus caldiproteolyticus]MBA2875620.1 putative YkwD family protein [Anoxybacillus caldiproteolyticus]
MIKKMTGFLAASALVMGLAACNIRDTDRNDNYDNKNMNISASYTSIPSNKYPHTRAVLIQDAKYKFVQVDPKEAAELQARLQQQLNGQYVLVPNQIQTPAQQQIQTPTQQQTQPKQQTPTQQQQAQVSTGISQYAQQVIELTNKERARAGLPALKADTQLSAVAQKKSQDMQQNHYFSHTSPTYGSPFDMMRDFGVTYKTAGENIAQGQRTPQEVVTAWMNSPGHRANILNKQFTHIGVGFEQAGNHWTQMFIGK